jgi:hypothetical protein
MFMGDVLYMYVVAAHRGDDQHDVDAPDLPRAEVRWQGAVPVSTET